MSGSFIFISASHTLLFSTRSVVCIKMVDVHNFDKTSFQNVITLFAHGIE